MIDAKRLNSITAGNKETEKRLLNLFISSSRNSFKKISDACMAENIKELKAAIHELQGASANMGIESIYKTCLDAEKTALDNKETRDMLLEAIRTELVKFTAFANSMN